LRRLNLQREKQEKGDRRSLHKNGG
jgi:hypothetical protein